MSNPNAHDIKILNGLIETTLDSADSYREAAEQTQDPHYRTLFERRSAERQLFSSQKSSSSFAAAAISSSALACAAMCDTLD